MSSALLASRRLAPRAAALACVLAASAARADVRVSHDEAEPALDVQLAPAGPWSLLRPYDATVLNPTGDLHGDGLPGSASRDELLLAAWTRPETSHLMVSRWEGARWEWLPSITAPAALGVPRVSPLGDGWALTWQATSEGVPVVVAAGASAGHETGPATPLLAGYLVDQTFSASVQVLLTMTPDRRWLVATGVLWSVPGVPSPIDVLWSVVLDEAPGERMRTARVRPDDGAPGRARILVGDDPDRVMTLHVSTGELATPPLRAENQLRAAFPRPGSPARGRRIGSELNSPLSAE
jgi:hypothetical protein